MADKTTETTVVSTVTTIQHKAARIAGTAYFLIIASSIASMLFGPFTLLVPGDTSATFANIASDILLFRAGILYDLLMYAGVVVLSVALYATLKPVNRYLALTAMLWRICEALLGCIGVLCSLVVLLLMGDGDYIAAMGSGLQQGLAGLALSIRAAVIPVVFTFLSLGSIAYCTLFFTSRYIPRWLSTFGIAAFTVTLAGTLAGILLPVIPATACGVPAILFEITIGLWLWIRGITTVPSEYSMSKITLSETGGSLQ